MSQVLKFYVMMKSVEMVEKNANTSKSAFLLFVFVCLFFFSIANFYHKQDHNSGQSYIHYGADSSYKFSRA